MAVKSNFNVPTNIDEADVLRRLLLQLVNKLDLVIARQSKPRLPASSNLDDVILAINETRGPM